MIMMQKVVPRLFTQLNMVQGLYKGLMVPLLYCLLSDKRRETYHSILMVPLLYCLLSDKRRETYHSILMVPLLYCLLSDKRRETYHSILMVPLLYCLLSDKRRETYHSIFDVMKQHRATDNRVLQHQKIMPVLNQVCYPAT